MPILLAQVWIAIVCTSADAIICKHNVCYLEKLDV